jgi:renalase
MSEVKKVVIVGAGLTGSLLHHLLRKHVPQLQLSIWEKSGSVGGRYNTSLPSGPAAVVPASASPPVHADLGAQYVTEFEPIAHKDYYQALIDNGVLQEIHHQEIHGGRGAHSEMRHHLVAAGVSSIPKFFMGDEAPIEFQRQLHSLSAQGQSWALVDKQGKQEQADLVVLTSPMADVLALEGSVQESLTPFKADLQNVSYSSRYALGVYYPVEAWTSLGSIAWRGKYFSPSDSDVIVWMSINNLNVAPTEACQGPSIVVHTTVPFGMKNGDTAHEEVKAIIMQHLNKLIPELAEVVPIESELLYWKVSQVYKGYQADKEIRSAALRVSEAPMLILAGDSFTKSGFDGCIESAEVACDMIKKAISGESCSAGDAPSVSMAGIAEQTAKAMA